MKALERKKTMGTRPDFFCHLFSYRQDTRGTIMLQYTRYEPFLEVLSRSASSQMAFFRPWQLISLNVLLQS